MTLACLLSIVVYLSACPCVCVCVCFGALIETTLSFVCFSMATESLIDKHHGGIAMKYALIYRYIFADPADVVMAEDDARPQSKSYSKSNLIDILLI